MARSIVAEQARKAPAQVSKLARKRECLGVGKVVPRRAGAGSAERLGKTCLQRLEPGQCGAELLRGLELSFELSAPELCPQRLNRCRELGRALLAQTCHSVLSTRKG